MRKRWLITSVVLFGIPWAMAVLAEEITGPVRVEISTGVPVAPSARRSGFNEMKGKFQSRSEDPKTLRVLVDGGFNVEFTYGSNTSLVNGGKPIPIDDLNFGDELVIRYSGRDLYAIEIERIQKAQQPY